MIILASASPRRQELLKAAGVDNFKIMPSKAEERADESLSPKETVKTLARIKAADVAAFCEESDIVIGADTMVYLEHRLLGKPKTELEAKEMLTALSGRKHTVYTGVAVVTGGRTLTDCQETDVYFRHLTQREIDAYIKTGEPMDKAGAYGIQGRGSIFIEKVDGDFFNVMGLPLCLLDRMLKDVGYNIF